MTGLRTRATRLIGVAALLAGLAAGAIAPTGASASPTLAQAIAQAPHPSLARVCGHRYAVYQQSVTNIGGHWDAVASATCRPGTPGEGIPLLDVSVYRLGPNGGLSLIQRLATMHFNASTNTAVYPMRFSLSGRTITVRYYVGNGTAAGPSKDGTRMFTWNGKNFTASPMRYRSR